MRGSAAYIGFALVALGWIVPLPQAQAQGVMDLRKIFPKEADVFVDRPGLSRLELPAEVLTECRPDLSDLRVFDPQGKEVPFLVMGRKPAPPLSSLQSADAAVLDVKREEIPAASGQGPSTYRETFEISVPTTAPAQGNWDLIFATSQDEFVRKVVVKTLGTAGPTELLQTSIFRLPKIPAEKTRIALPPLAVPRLQITVEGEGGLYLDPQLRFESSQEHYLGGEMVVPLAQLSRQEVAGKTLVELARPRGLLLDKIRLETSTPSFHRGVAVFDAGLGSDPAMLGQQTLFRVGTSTPVGQSELPLRAAQGGRLRVEITNGDSPPLEELRFSAVVPQPSLVFSLAPQPLGQAAGVLRFGGGRGHLPRYDLEGLLPGSQPEAEGTRGEALDRLFSPSQVGHASLGSIRPNPAFNAEPILAFAMRAGVKVNPRLYTHRRKLEVHPSPDGLTRIALSPEDLASARTDLADLRVVDGQQQQWPYLLEAGLEKKDLPLTAALPDTQNGKSTYKLSLPVSRLQVQQLTLNLANPFFDRAYELYGTTPDNKEVLLASGRLVRRVGEVQPLSLDLNAAWVTGLRLQIDDGNDAPLTLSGVATRLEMPALFLAAPAGDYFLLLGNAEDQTPHYELASARDVILSVQGADAATGAMEKNPDFSQGAQLVTGGGKEKTLLWVVLVGAVVGLGAISLKLARK